MEAGPTNSIPQQNQSILAAIKIAIQQIKHQKQRPELKRIMNFMRLHSDFRDQKTIQDAVNQAIEAGQLFKVTVDGQETYKDPESLRSLRKFRVELPMHARRAVKLAVKELGESNEQTILKYIEASFPIGPVDLPLLVRNACSLLTKLSELFLSNGCYSRNIPEKIGSASTNSFRQNSTTLVPEIHPATTGVGSLPPILAAAGLQRADANGGRDFGIIPDVPSGPGFLFQCWCCDVFVAQPSAFLTHVAGDRHIQQTRNKLVYCSSCKFHSREPDHLLEHLVKYVCHENLGHRPACLISFSPIQMTSKKKPLKRK